MSIIPLLLERIAARPSVPVLIESDPGQGKTFIIEEWAAQHGLPLVKLLASTMDETDIAGIIVHDKNTNSATTVSPDWYQKLKPDNGYGGRGILFCDELNTARKEVADTLLTLVCSRHLPNGDRLGDGVMIVAAQNDAKQCDNYELSPAMRTRFMKCGHAAKPMEWLQWFVGKQHSLDTLLPPYQTLKEWLAWFHSDPDNGADKKALVTAAIKEKGLSFDSGDDFVKKDLPTTPRGLTNLAYWTSSAAEMLQWAQGFVSPETATILKSVDSSVYHNVGNSIFANKGKQKAVSAEESAKVQAQAAVHNKIQQAVSLV